MKKFGEKFGNETIFYLQKRSLVPVRKVVKIGMNSRLKLEKVIFTIMLNVLKPTY